MRPGGAAAGAAQASTALPILPPSAPRQWTRADVLALSAERELWQARADAAFAAGYRQAEDDLAGRPGFAQAARDAFAAGRRAACPDQPGFDEGWEACWARFADELGGRLFPEAIIRADGSVKRIRPTEAELRMWTRHAPRCRHGGRGGTQSCQRSGCLPGGRADFGKPRPWDRRA